MLKSMLNDPSSNKSFSFDLLLISKYFKIESSKITINLICNDEKATAGLACGGGLHERSPMNKKTGSTIQLIYSGCDISVRYRKTNNNKIVVCGVYGAVVWVQDRKASYRFLNWFTEVALMTEAGRAFHSLISLFTFGVGLAGQSSRSVRKSEFAGTGGFTHSTSLMPLASLNIWIRSPRTRRSWRELRANVTPRSFSEKLLIFN
ncbi:hypothetical protein BpHYR1_028191 [Brachionus plicatilis]|uniref:Uncharacterized protein n=1 Tax=Brachionus plicatilis TaxID=10195 RepID=A0A3M7Q0Z1_BRAPC|nr:hypothetical protein BpHYR1_028191 [Brachionus plicatilis]